MKKPYITDFERWNKDDSLFGAMAMMAFYIAKIKRELSRMIEKTFYVTMKHLFLIAIALLSFGVKGQVYTINANGDTINTAYGAHTMYHVTTGTSGNKYGKAAIDTPQADRNPNDFYIPDVKISTGLEPKVLSLEEKLLMYASECWNDSTKVYKEVNRLVKTHWSDGDTVSLYMPVKKYFYIHREPTFKGFIEYLKKK